MKTLFRGKKIDSNEWVYGSLVETDLRKYIAEIYNCDITDIKLMQVQSDTVGLFTGLTESKNHPMFDDNIKLWEDDIFTIGKYDTKYKVVFENLEWIGVSSESDDWGKFKFRLSAIKEPIHILGNVHDNPEMFETI
jgi:hypothetical protein